MFRSISNRVISLGLVVVVALVFLAGLLADASYRTTESFRWVIHSVEIIETTEAALGDLSEAESGQRGFILTRDATHLRTFAQRIASASQNIDRVANLTRDNPLQHARAREIAELMARRAESLRRPLDLGQQGNFSAATAIIVEGRGSELMNAITVRADRFLNDERALQTRRMEAADRRLARGKWLALVGASVVAVVVLFGFALLIRSIRQPLDAMMQVMTDLGSGTRGARVVTKMGSREFDRLAEGYNAMAEELTRAETEQAASEQRLQIANTELYRNSEMLRDRSEMIELLGGMAHRMQAARVESELSQIVQVFLPRVLPGISGVLYAHNNSRNLLVPIADWGGPDIAAEGFGPEQCWALRRGQSHCVREVGHDIVCGHASPEVSYHCEPLLAAGEVIGILYLEGRMEAGSGFGLRVLAENIASALVNFRLQRSLREQTIRDPLTGLFNRRYLEETLKLEIARAKRPGAPLSLVMCDVDHFKRFNDEHGHDAGDTVLKAVADEMKRHFRDGDVLCRFGGEEFTIIAPGTTAEAMLGRVEDVRQAISGLTLAHGGRTLGSTSMSFGIANWAMGMDKDGATLIQAADAALYQAKREGRNRAAISRLAA